MGSKEMKAANVHTEIILGRAAMKVILLVGFNELVSYLYFAMIVRLSIEIAPVKLRKKMYILQPKNQKSSSHLAIIIILLETKILEEIRF